MTLGVVESVGVPALVSVSGCQAVVDAPSVGNLEHLTSLRIEAGDEPGLICASLEFEAVREPREVVSAALASQKLYPIELRMEKPRLEDVFLELTEDADTKKEGSK